MAFLFETNPGGGGGGGRGSSSSGLSSSGSSSSSSPTRSRGGGGGGGSSNRTQRRRQTPNPTRRLGSKGRGPFVFDQRLDDAYNPIATPLVSPFDGHYDRPTDAYGSPFSVPPPRVRPGRRPAPGVSDPNAFSMTGAGQFFYEQNPDKLWGRLESRSGLAGTNAGQGFRDFSTGLFDRVYGDYQQAAGNNPLLTFRDYTQTLFGADPTTVPPPSPPMFRNPRGKGKRPGGGRRPPVAPRPLYASPQGFGQFATNAYLAATPDLRGEDPQRWGVGPARWSAF